jgi:hypothetical protein
MHQLITGKATGAAADPALTDGCSMDSQMDKQGNASPHMSLLQELEQLMDPAFTHNSKSFPSRCYRLRLFIY